MALTAASPITQLVGRSPLLTLPSMGLTWPGSKRPAAAVRTEDDYLTELASHLIVAGGKRLRPVVAMAAAQPGPSAGPATG